MTNIQSQSNVAKEAKGIGSEKANAPAKKAKAQKAGLVKGLVGSIQSLRAFLAETRAELSKVSWLGRDKVAAYVTVVMVITGVITAYVTFADVLIARAFELIGTIFI